MSKIWQEGGCSPLRVMTIKWFESTTTTMNYKKYIIDMILQMSRSHSKLELYTMSTRDLVYIKDELLDNVNLKN